MITMTCLFGLTGVVLLMFARAPYAMSLARARALDDESQGATA